MNSYIYTIFSLLFLASSLVSFFVSYLAYSRRSVRGSLELSLLMLSAGVWAFLIIFETASTTLEEKIFWSKVAYIGALTNPVFYLLFVLRFTGRDKYFTTKCLAALFSTPIVVFILTLTNDYHNLIWTGYAPISKSTNLTQYFHGVGFWVGHAGYSYLLMLISSLYIMRFIVNQISAFRSQAIYIFSASLCPWIASIFYLSGNNPVPGFDLVPLSMIFSGTIFAVAIYRNRFLDLAPVARETMLESIEDGILVLDKNMRIQDINNSALGFLGIEKKRYNRSQLYIIRDSKPVAERGN